jgi:hypothetical protein
MERELTPFLAGILTGLMLALVVLAIITKDSGEDE